MERSRRVFFLPLRALVLAFYWISSTAASNKTSDTTTNNGSSETSDKPFSCEWKDLEFPITYGPGIACSLCILIGGFHVIVGEDKTLRVFYSFATISNHVSVLILLKIQSSQHTALITKKILKVHKPF